MKINCKLMAVLLFALAVSICAGSFFEASMTGKGKDELEKLLGNLLQSDNGRQVAFRDICLPYLHS